MKKSKFSALMVFIAILAMLALVACGGGAATETPAEEPAAEEPAAEQPAAEEPAAEVSGKVGIVLPTRDEPR
ncbi:MAG TPA: hypothetical protein PKE20_11720, partial [Promineifilum sp.]|nr:hypothetical protein [Promineifilum sp.]